jgi:hypothetical protein
MKESTFKPNVTTKLDSDVPTSVKKQLWEKVYLYHFEYDGKYYYIDKRHESPFGYEYDFWNYSTPNGIQGRVVIKELVEELTNYINRIKKIKKILNKE